MNIQTAVNTLRKFNNFVQGLFPFIGRLQTGVGQWVAWCLAHPRVAPKWSKVRDSHLAQTVRSVLQRFYWRDYSKDRLDLTHFTPEAVAVLRPVFLITMALCLLLPAAVLFPKPPLPAGAFEGAGGGPVAGWSVVLWALSAALGWGCLLAGTAAANRPAFVFASLAFIYLAGGTAFQIVVGGPQQIRSSWNALVPILVLTAAVTCESWLSKPSFRNLLSSLGASLVVGLAAGLYLVMFTPLAGLVRGKILWVGLALGTFFGLAIFGWGRLKARVNQLPEPEKLTRPVHLLVSGLSVGVLLFFGSLVGRGALAGFGGAFLPLLKLGNSYLWPLWYFIGVGIIYKMIKNSKIITGAVRDLVRPGLLIPLAAIFFLGGAALTWSEWFLDTQALWPSWVLQAAGFLYHHTAGWIWNVPVQSFSVEWMRWVFLFDVVALGWLIARRRLNTDTVAGLLFQTLLAWFLIFEYFFEYSSFNRSGTHSVIGLTLFSVWLLWLMHSVGLNLSVKSSPRWPAVGRLPVYGALLLFVLLEIHARTAVGDYSVMNEIFLYLFRGIIDVGLPYALYVYAGRRFKELPLSTGRLFAAFCLGIAATIPLNILDKLVAAEGSWPQLRAQVSLALKAMLEGGTPFPITPALPAWWLALRGGLVIAGLAILAAATRRWVLRRGASAGTVAFALMAAATGLASFSKTKVIWPLLPPWIWLLIGPWQQSLELDVNLLVLYLAYALPALVIGLAVAGGRGRRIGWWLGGLAAAYVLHLVVMLNWPSQEAWLRSTGVIVTAALAGGLLFLLLIRQAGRLIEAPLAPAPDLSSDHQGQPAPAPPLGPTAVKALTVTAAVILLVVAGYQLRQGQLKLQTMTGISCPLAIPSAWRAVNSNSSTAAVACFVQDNLSPPKPVLLVEERTCPTDGPIALLEGLVKESRQTLRGYKPTKLEQWDQHYPGAVALDFQMETPGPGGAVQPFIGTTVLLPGSNGRVVILSLVCGPGDFSDRRWDLALIAQRARR